MKKVFNLAIIFAIVPLLLVTSCKKDDDDPKPADNKFEVLKEYLIDNNMDIDNILDGWITTAEAVNTAGVENFYILDIRGADDFANGHINGAHNTTLGGILDAAANADKPIIVVCYTGQTAGHAVVALRMSGYSDAKVLKWGMSGWHSDFSGPWNGNVGDAGAGHTNWTAAPGDITPSIDFNEYPTITSQYDDGVNILNERIAAFLEGGFKGVTNAAVLDTPSDYFINNYWAETDVTEYGHIATAYRVLPMTLKNNEIRNLDPNKPVVTYCWTGQTSSMVTAYLNIIGYEALSLKFGANGMIYNNLHSHKWDGSVVPDYEYVSGN